MSRDRRQPNYFAGPYLDRRAEVRETAGWHIEALSDPATRFVVSRGTRQLLHLQPEPRIAFLTPEHPTVRRAREEQLVLLGWFRDTRCVLVEVEDDDEVLPGTRFEELRPLTSLLGAQEAGLLAYARALSIWRARTRYCGACGAPNRPERAGHVLRCTRESCGQESFPRIDPAIIVLVTDGERALLGRQANWPAGRYSTIAGFVEPGESLEDAVAREVLEETGVHVRDVDYHSSQPWPFPSSIMIGFQATAEPGSRIRLGSELEDARWFTRTEILSEASTAPPSQAISWRLIDAWLGT